MVIVAVIAASAGGLNKAVEWERLSSDNHHRAAMHTDAERQQRWAMSPAGRARMDRHAVPRR